MMDFIGLEAREGIFGRDDVRIICSDKLEKSVKIIRICWEGQKFKLIAYLWPE